jgi:1-acyl-sn-glycerol-3-phosphate acyltransferase
MTPTQSSPQPGSVVLFIRSLLFSIGMIVTVMFWGLVVVLSTPLAFERRFRIARQWNRFVIWWLKQTCKIDCRISGLEYIPEGPIIVAAKHQSAWETLFLQQFLPPLTWVLKKELLWVPFFGWAMAALEPIAIDRKAAISALKQVVRQGAERLAQGRWVLIFPEGTRMAPGVRGTYGASAALLAVNSGYPILPVAHNAGKFWPRQGFLKRPGTIELVFGPLISSTGHKPKELNTLVENWIESTMVRISHRSEKPVELSG